MYNRAVISSRTEEGDEVKFRIYSYRNAGNGSFN